MSLFSEDDDLDAALQSWIRKHRHSRILELWLNGVEIDWKRLHGACGSAPHQPAHISILSQTVLAQAIQRRDGVPVGKTAPGVGEETARDQSDWLFVEEDWCPAPLPATRLETPVESEGRAADRNCIF